MDYVPGYDAEGKEIPYRYRSDVKARQREIEEKERKEHEAFLEAREKRWAEEERLRKIKEAIPKLTAKRVADIARNKNMWLYDPKTKQWWTPEEYVEAFGRIIGGQQEYIKRVEMRDPVQALNKSFETLRGDIEFEDRDKLIKKFDRFRVFVERVVGYYRTLR